MRFHSVEFCCRVFKDVDAVYELGGKTLCGCILQSATRGPRCIDAVRRQFLVASRTILSRRDMHVSGMSRIPGYLPRACQAHCVASLGNAHSTYGGQRRPRRSLHGPRPNARPSHPPGGAHRVRRRRTSVGDAEPHRALVDDGVQVPVRDARVDGRDLVCGTSGRVCWVSVLTGGVVNAGGLCAVQGDGGGEAGVCQGYCGVGGCVARSNGVMADVRTHSVQVEIAQENAGGRAAVYAHCEGTRGDEFWIRVCQHVRCFWRTGPSSGTVAANTGMRQM